MNGKVTRRQFLLGSIGILAGGSAIISRGYRVNEETPAYQYWRKRHKGTLTDLEYVALCGLLAPSAHNTQPWKYQLLGNRIEVYADRTRGLGSADRDHRLILLSVGCSLENLALAAARLGYLAAVEITADRKFETCGHCGTLTLTKARHIQQPRRFEAIFHRQTTRSGFDPRYTVPTGLKRHLDRESVREGLGLLWIDDAASRRATVRALRAAVRAYLADDYRHRDGMRWFRRTRREWEAKGDGIAIFTTDAPAFVKQWVEWFATADDLVGEDFKRGEIETVDRLAAETPTWGLIFADRPSHTLRVHGGRLLERVYLEATVRGLAVQPMSYLSEVAPAVDGTRTFGLPAQAEILALFRIGKAPPLERSVRRRLKEVLI